MKKIGAILMALIIAYAMSGCGSRDPITDASPSPSSDPLAAFAPSPSPTNGMADPPDDIDDGPADDDLSGLIDESGDDPMIGDAGDAPDDEDEPTPSPASASPTPSAAAVDIKPADYVLTPYTDDDLLLSIDYPTHWTVETSENSNSLRFVEPVADGKTPMRLTLTVRTYEEDKLTTANQKKLFQDFVNNLKSDYGAFKAGKPTNATPFINRPALSVTYQAKLDGANIKGYVIMTAIPTTKQIVALHFSAPQAKYKNASTFFKKILYSVAPVKPETTD